MRRRHAMPFGAELTERGTRFALWAPSARSVALMVDGREIPMAPSDGGWRSCLVPDVGAGARYGYAIDGGDPVPDPASRFQPDDLLGLSEVVDPRAYDWQDRGWAGRPWEEAVIREVHVGTATPEGTFRALADQLESIRDTGFTLVELLPIADFPGRRNWGYDGVLTYAPDSAYGRPEDLKHLVDRAHALGIGMVLDVVYNHFGPMGNYLHSYAKQFFTERHQTPWGAGINFDGENGRPVRDYFIHNALYWLEEYHFDGLRFDAVHAIKDDSPTWVVAEIAERCRAAHPGRPIHLMLENEANEARWLERDASGRPVLDTAQWADDIHHCWHVLLTGESEGYYEDFADDPVGRLGRALAEGFVYQGEPSAHAGGTPRGEPSGHLPPSAFVACLQNHDQIGNRALGERLSTLVPEPKLALARAGLLLAPQIPMLFMGGEWSASQPFPFFVDFADDPELSKAVRDGRRREFQHFAAFKDPDSVPDPTTEDTFRSGILDPAEAGREPHAAVLADTRDLIGRRLAHVVPLTRTAFGGGTYRVLDGDGLLVEWHFAAGTLAFVANLGDRPLAIERPAGDLVWTNAPTGGPLPAWTGLFTVEPTRER